MGASRWHRHELHRMDATTLDCFGFAPYVASVALSHAHVAQGATAVFARSYCQREHQNVLQAVADRIGRIATIGNIVCLAIAIITSKAARQLLQLKDVLVNTKTNTSQLLLYGVIALAERHAVYWHKSSDFSGTADG